MRFSAPFTRAPGLSYNAWLNPFSLNLAILNQDFALDGVRTKLVGILSAPFTPPDRYSAGISFCAVPEGLLFPLRNVAMPKRRAKTQEVRLLDCRINRLPAVSNRVACFETQPGTIRTRNPLVRWIVRRYWNSEGRPPRQSQARYFSRFKKRRNAIRQHHYDEDPAHEHLGPALAVAFEVL